MFAILLLVLIAAMPLISGATAPRFDEAQLVKTAETDGYGYKYGNLAELQTLTNWFNRQAGDAAKLQVQVPEFFGINSQLIVSKLLERGFNAESQWAEVLATVPEATHEAVMANKKLPDAFWDAQKAFTARLGTALDGMITALSSTSFDELLASSGASETKESSPADSGTEAGAGETKAGSPTGTSSHDALIEQVKEAADMFMVRSTGKEDTRTMANAGGNESVANVAPNSAAIWAAAKRVILSYFGEKSLKQRLGLGDTSLFTPEVFCPVLVQRMIGERSAENIPSCGVMFTEEAEGGISGSETKDADEHMQTTGITSIQAAYGHNEGVVNSLIVVDTYIAQPIPGSETPAFYPIIRAKRQRLVPVARHSELERTANPNELVLAPALSNNMLVTLKQFADALEQYYGYPMDVEFVVRNEARTNPSRRSSPDGSSSFQPSPPKSGFGGQAGRAGDESPSDTTTVIYIVQARPIVHKAKRATPSYITNLAIYPNEAVFKGRTIGANGGGIVTLSSPDQVIMAPTINRALAIYQERGGNAVQAVIVGADAPALSHEATMFRSEGKPVIFIRDFQPLSDALAADKKLIFSPQQHRVIIPADTEPTITAGWCSYPLPPEVSVAGALFLGNEPTTSTDGTHSEDFKRLVNTRHTDKPAELLEIMRTGNPADVTTATQQLLAIVARAITKFGHTVVGREIENSADLAQQIAALHHAIKIICNNVIAHAGIDREHQRYITRLLPILQLEALLYQHVRSTDMAAPWSVGTLLSTLKSESTPARSPSLEHHRASPTPEPSAPLTRSTSITKPADPTTFASPENKAYFFQLKKLDTIIFDEQSQNLWATLIKASAEAKNPKVIAALSTLVATLQNFDLLPIWLHSTMGTDLEHALTASAGKLKSTDILTLIKNWVTPLKDAGRFLLEIKQLRAIIASFQIAGFESKSKFTAAWKLFNDTLLAPICSDEFAIAFAAANSTAKLAACAMFTDFINLFDSCIKTLKPSDNYELAEKLACFKTMLIAENELLKIFFEKFVPKGVIRYPQGSPLEKYLELTTHLVSKEFSKADLDPTPGIEVFNFSIGCEHDFVVDSTRNKQPASGEDAFSIIHQSLLNGCSTIAISNGASTITRPPLLSSIETIFKTQRAEAGARAKTPKLIGTEITKDGATVRYNQPLGSHSCQITLQYKNKTKDIDIRLHFSGGDKSEQYRWINAAAQTVIAGSMDELATTLTPRIVNLTPHTLILDFTIKASSTCPQFTTLWLELLKIADSSPANPDLFSYSWNNTRNLQYLKQLPLFGTIGNEACSVLYNCLPLDLLRLKIVTASKFTETHPYHALAILTALVNHNESYAEATIAATTFIKTHTEQALYLFTALVNHNEVNVEAIIAATTFIKTHTEQAFDLFLALIDKSQAYTEAATAARELIVNNIRLDLALKIFTTLVQKKQAYQEASEAYRIHKLYRTRPDAHVQMNAAELFKMLGKNYVAATPTPAPVAAPDAVPAS